MQHIFAADVHGCADELDRLLERARNTYGDRFELWVIGDLINRGPDNLRALLRVRELVEEGRAHYVLGNHELNLLLTAAGLRRLEQRDTFAGLLAAPDASDWIEWLRRRPLVEVGQLGRQPFAVVHAAAHPDWDLDELQDRARHVEARLGSADRRVAEHFLAADPRRDPARDDLGRLSSCRTITQKGVWSTELPAEGADAWHQQWSARRHGYGIVYGHWALQGLHVAPWLRGLDTGCVHHGRDRDGALTAWLPDPGSERPFDVPDLRFWRTPTSRAYYIG